MGGGALRKVLISARMASSWASISALAVIGSGGAIGRAGSGSLGSTRPNPDPTVWNSSGMPVGNCSGVGSLYDIYSNAPSKNMPPRMIRGRREMCLLRASFSLPSMASSRFLSSFGSLILHALAHVLHADFLLPKAQNPTGIHARDTDHTV